MAFDAPPAICAMVIGIVTNLEDPDKLGRIKVKYPHLGDEQSNWARLVSPMGGSERGVFFRPEVNDEVLVTFLQGDMRFPMILGGLWNGKDKPPKDDGKAKENNWRFIKSRSGHLLKLDDTKGKEKIEIIDKGQKHKIVIDCSGKKIQITCDAGDIELSAKAGAIKMEAKTITLKATAAMTLEAGAAVTVKGKPIKLN